MTKHEKSRALHRVPQEQGPGTNCPDLLGGQWNPEYSDTEHKQQPGTPFWCKKDAMDSLPSKEKDANGDHYHIQDSLRGQHSICWNSETRFASSTVMKAQHCCMYVIRILRGWSIRYQQGPGVSGR